MNGTHCFVYKLYYSITACRVSRHAVKVITAAYDCAYGGCILHEIPFDKFYGKSRTDHFITRTQFAAKFP